MRRKILTLLSAIFILIGCNSQNDTISYTNPTNNNTTPPSNQQTSSIQITSYFSKNSGSFSGGVDDLIIKDIDMAKNSIYLAMYDFTNDKIKEALIRAKDRGVEVKIITDNSKINDEDYQDLKNANIEVIGYNNEDGIMHDKFLIIDQNSTWSGSGNYTYYSFYRNYENFVSIKSQDVAKAYTHEFNEMLNHYLIHQIYSFNNLQIYFSPEDNFKYKFISLIDGAKKSIKFLIFAFTDEDIANALIRAKNRGVIVKGVFDEDQNSFQTSSKYQYLLDNGIDVKLDGNSYKLHDKVAIIDDNITITGSYNFTETANDINNENILIIYNRDIALKYVNEFDRIYQEAK